MNERLIATLVRELREFGYPYVTQQDVEDAVSRYEHNDIRHDNVIDVMVAQILGDTQKVVP